LGGDLLTEEQKQQLTERFLQQAAIRHEDPTTTIGSAFASPAGPSAQLRITSTSTPSIDATNIVRNQGFMKFGLMEPPQGHSSQPSHKAPAFQEAKPTVCQHQEPGGGNNGSPPVSEPVTAFHTFDWSATLGLIQKRFDPRPHSVRFGFILLLG
jgi:hypothetical protein